MTYFEEYQKFRNGLIILFPTAIFGIIPLVVMGKEGRLITGILLSAALIALPALLLYSMRQIVRIDKAGIHYKQSPFHRKFRTILWTNVRDWEIAKMNALSDFGGWGIRFTKQKKGYIIEGEFGLEINTGEKKTTVLSIKNRVEAERYMSLFSKKELEKV